MAKNRYSEVLEANVWPAVTDTMILMASIFIVLSVVAMASMARKLDDQLGEGKQRGETVKCVRYSIKEGMLFGDGQRDLRDAAKARKVVSEILRDIPDKEVLGKLREFAKRQKDWKGQFYVIIEVAGHADYIPMRGNRAGEDGNWSLSTDRANEVVHVIEQILKSDRSLRDSLGVKQNSTYNYAQSGSTVVRAAGYSSHLPSVLYKTGSDKERRENRRVEIRVFVQPDYVVQLRKDQ